MVSQLDYDIVIQLSSDVLRDVQTRVLNAWLLTNLSLTSPISRVLAHTVTPFQMKAHWAEPVINIAEEVVTLSADVAGGARYFVKGINLTMEGQVGAECRPRAVVNASGQPVVTLMTPSPLELDLADLELSYQGDDELPTLVDTTIESTLLRPTLCAQLMAPLANLPLNYLPDAVPLRVTPELHHGTAPADGLALADAVASLESASESLTLAMSCVPHSATSASPPNLLSDHSTANTAVALSETGLNQTLSWLCAQGLATGTTPQPHGPVPWRWAHASASFTDHAIHLTGELWHGESATEVDAELQCSLTSSAQLSVHLTAPDPPPAHAEVLLDAWAHLLRRTFFAASRLPEPTQHATTEPDSAEPLRQRFVIPDTDLSTEALAVGLRLRDGYLAALYVVSPDEQSLTLTLSENKPAPTIGQLVVPLQDAPGAPVSTQLAAALADSSQPPYDYVWRVDQELHPHQHHSPTITVTKTPAPTVGTGEPQQLATVTLKVIDILGQVGEAEVDAMYYPATAQQNQDQETRQDGKQETQPIPAVPNDAGGLLASARRFYQKWKNWAGHHKAAAAVVRVAGPALVSAIVVAALAIPGEANPPGAQPSQAPTPSPSVENPGPGNPGPGNPGPGNPGSGGSGSGGSGSGGSGSGGSGSGGSGSGGSGSGGSGSGGSGSGGSGSGGSGSGGSGSGGSGSGGSGSGGSGSGGSGSGGSGPNGTPTTSTTAPRPVTVPDVVGQPSATATSTLTSLGLTVTTIESPSNTIPAGSVVAQTPGSGTAVPAGSQVTLTISTGKRPPFLLIDEAPNAAWTTGAGTIPFGGSDGDVRGFALIRPANSFLLEDGTAPQYLEMHPEWVDFGWINGVYTLPGPIMAGDHFRVRIGFMKPCCNVSAGDAEFVVRLRRSGTWIEVSRTHDIGRDGILHDIDVDLSTMQGATAVMLRVEAGASADQDWAAWIRPRIEG